MRRPKFADIDIEMYIWMLQQRDPSNPKPIQLISLQVQAQRINEEFRAAGSPSYAPEFQATSGWAQKFIARHGLHGLDIVGETLSADKRSAEEHRAVVQRLMDEHDVDPRDASNMDEGGVCYKSLPVRTYALSTKKTAKGTKVQKERITLGFCAHATGSGSHKIPLLVIGKSKKPRCFRNASEINHLPVVYTHSKKAWMNQFIFEDWVTFTFLPEVNKRQREEGRVGNILLLLDNFSAHKCLSERLTSSGRLIISFLPENTTSLIQPMDQGMIVKVKRLYRRALVGRLLDFAGTQDEFYKSIRVKEACFMLHEAWQQVTSDNIKISFRKIMPEEQVSSTAEAEPQSAVAAVEELTGRLRQRQELSALSEDDVWVCQRRAVRGSHGGTRR